MHLGSKCQSNFCWKQIESRWVPVMHPQNLHTLRAWLTEVRRSISWWKWVYMLSKDIFLDELEQCALSKQQFSLVDLSPLCCAYRYPHTVVTILGIFVCTSFLNVRPGYKMTAIIQTEGWSSLSRNQAGIKGAVKEENMWNTTNLPSKIHEKDPNWREGLLFPT